MCRSLGRAQEWGVRPKSITKVTEFVVIDGVVIVGREIVGGDSVRGCVVAVVFVGVDKEIWTPFDDQATVLEKWLPFIGGHGLNAGNDGVVDGENLPLVSREAGPGGQGQEIVIAIRVAGRGKGDCADRTRFWGVGRVVSFKNLDVRPEFESKFVEIGGRDAGNQRRGAHSL